MTPLSRIGIPFFHRPSRAIAEKVGHFRDNGYVIFERAIDADLIDRFWADVERQIEDNPDLTFSVHEKVFSNAERKRLSGAERTTLRIIDIERHSSLAGALILHDVCSKFLTALYGGVKPTCIQTLTYEKSSEQGAHSDKFLVSPPTVGPAYDRETLAASWIACEDADEGNGALTIYPGSHKIEKRRLGEDIPQYGAYVAHLKEACAKAGCAPRTFTAKKGDVLFWDGDFVHAGGPILDKSRTRKSLVSHYARVPAFHHFAGAARQRVSTRMGSYYA